MADADFAAMNYSELIALQAKLDRRVREQREAELKSVLEELTEALQAAGVTFDEAMRAMKSALQKEHASCGGTTSVQPLTGPAHAFVTRQTASSWLH